MLRRLAALSFKLGSKLFRGSGITRLSLIRFIKDRLFKYLKQTIPSYITINEHVLFLDNQDRLELSIRGSYEPYETKLLKKLIHPGDTTLDIGAHIGYHTLTMARLVGKKGKVIAFEPDPINFAILEKNITANKYSNIQAIKKGVSESTSNKTFYYPFNRDSGSLLESKKYRRGKSTTIDTISLDNFIKSDKVDFIKIDVDGTEHLVLQGMKSLLKRESLVLLIEYDVKSLINIGHDSQKDFELLQSNRFAIYSLHKHKNKIIKIDNPNQITGRDLLCIKGAKML